jgi:hypothetical protein
MDRTIDWGTVNNLGTDQAFGDFHDCIAAQLNKLCADTVGVSERSDSPLFPTDQMFHFGCESQDEKHLFALYFVYGQDEETILAHAFTSHRKR